MSLLKTGVRLCQQSLKVQTRDECRKWIRECNKVLPSLVDYQRNERNKLPVEKKRRITLIIGKLKASLKKLRRQRKALRDARVSSLVWRDVESAFENRIFTGAVVNANHVDPREFLRDARKMVTSRVASAIETHNCIKINTTFKVEFILKGTVSVQFLNTRYSELYASSNLSAWYSRNVIEPTLTSVEELQERDSGWAFSRILCLMINVNKYEPMHAGCNVPIPRKLSSKKATINVTCSDANDHACFFRAVVASVYPVSTNVSRESSYPHYSTVLRTNGLQLPMTLEQIPTFERLNDISINVYIWKDEICKTLHLTSKKRNRHANLLLVQSPSDPSTNHFVCIRNLSRLVSSQRSKHEHKKYFCDRCLHYFSSEIKLKIHTIDCQRLNKSEIRLPKEKDKWLRFKNFLFKERMPFVIYADLECLLDVDLDDGPDKVGCSRELDKRELYQHHRVFNKHSNEAAYRGAT
ncbi:hypothetical protein KPH14_008018 [Odynerus spinipes]|uniref:C2H2-type domain-containing protein n=1 Tax=Odynerus spinipes TaxID=1348599 RepID=A0AAD9RK55_9HYME|nr:hypothetical protein KPH14_008018 [Odynerus spinipes]